MAEKEAQEEAGKQHVTKKTHKGVEEVADEDLSSLVNVEVKYLKHTLDFRDKLNGRNIILDAETNSIPLECHVMFHTNKLSKSGKMDS